MSGETNFRWHVMTLKWYCCIHEVDQLFNQFILKYIGTVFSPLVTRTDKPCSGTTDGGTSELCVVFLLGEWLYILTVWLAFCFSYLATHWCFQSETKCNRCGLRQSEWPLWHRTENTKLLSKGHWIVSSIMLLFF